MREVVIRMIMMRHTLRLAEMVSRMSEKPATTATHQTSMPVSVLARRMPVVTAFRSVRHPFPCQVSPVMMATRLWVTDVPQPVSPRRATTVNGTMLYRETNAPFLSVVVSKPMTFFFSKKEPKKDAPPQSGTHSCPPGASSCTEEQKPWERTGPLPRREWKMIGSGAMALLLLVGGMSYVGFQGSEDLPIPTLALDIAPQYSPSLLGSLVGEKDGIPVHVFSAEEARVGFTAIKDEHVIFDCPGAVTPNLEVQVAHGDQEVFSTVRYWGYEYSGRELQNKNAGKTGRELFDGRFWLSQKELHVSPQFTYLHTQEMEMVQGKRYYLMVDGVTGGAAPFRVSCFDSDRDFLNDGREDKNGNGVVDIGETNPGDIDTDDDALQDGSEIFGLDPLKIDTDEDCIQDGTELGFRDAPTADTNSAVFTPDADPETTTQPTNADTDGDGLWDGVEDANKNGRLDEGETNPLVADAPVCGDGSIWGGEAGEDGDTASGDGCSAACSIENGWQCAGTPSVCEIITPTLSDSNAGVLADLFVVERSLGTTDTVVENARDVLLFRFEATAVTSENISLTRIVLKSDAGTLIDAQNYTLLVDTNNDNNVDEILQSGVPAQNSKVSFDQLAGGGHTILGDTSVRFEVHADIASSLTGDELSLGFDDNNGVATTFNFIEAENADNGAPVSCISVDGMASTTTGCASNIKIIVNTTASKVFHLKEQGTLFVVNDASPTRSRQLLAGELGEAVLRLELRADDEAIDVTRLVITNSGASSANISRFQLYRPGEITHFASATADNCTSISTDFFAGTSGTSGAAQAFCAIMESQQLVIAEGLREDVLVRPLMKTDEQGAVSSSTDGGLGLVRAMILPNTLSNGVGQTNNTMGTGSITARGLLSSNVLLTNDNDTNQDGEIVIGSDTPGVDALIIGNKNDTVLAKIATIENVNPAADGTNVPTGTNKTIAEFKFTAATNNNTLNGRNKATLSGLIFNISSTNVNFTAANFDLFNKNDQTQEINCVPYDSYDSPGDAYSETMIADSFFVECKRSDNTAVNVEMDSGGSITLVLQADISNNQVQASAGSLLTVFLNNLSQGLLGGPGGMYAPTPFGTHIQWLDGTQVFSWVEYPETEIRSTNYDL